MCVFVYVLITYCVSLYYMSKQVISVRIDKELHSRIAGLAEGRGISKSELIGELLEKGLDKTGSEDVEFLKEQIRIKDEQIRQNQELAKALSVITVSRQEQPLLIEKKSFWQKLFGG